MKLSRFVKTGTTGSSCTPGMPHDISCGSAVSQRDGASCTSGCKPERLSSNPLHKIDSRFIRFVLVGMLNTAFGVGVYCLMIFIGLPYFVAALFSNVLGVLFNFKTTGKFVFENEDNRLIIRFVLCYVLVYLVNTGVIKLLLQTGMNDYWSGILATPVVAVCSFFMLKCFVYKKR